MPETVGGKSKSDNERSKTQLLFEGLSAMINTLGLDVVAEGLETKEQLELALSLDLATVQGYFFSKPLSYDGILDFIQRWPGEGGQLIANSKHQSAKLLHLHKEA